MTSRHTLSRLQRLALQGDGDAVKALDTWAQRHGDPYSALISLCAQPASRSGWDQIVAHLERWPDDEPGLEVGFEALEPLLSRWPDKRRLCPREWWEMTLDGEGPPPYWKLARTLKIPSHLMSRPFLLRLEACPHWGAITVLDLERCQIGDEGLSLIVAMEMPNLKRLELCDNDLTQISPPLGRTSTFPALTRLNLRHNRITSLELRRLAGRPVMAQITDLSLGKNELGSGLDAILPLTESPHLGPLTHLDLQWNSIGDEGLSKLAGSASMRHLTHLFLENADIGDAGIKALATSPHVQKLVRLDLDSNAITSVGARAIAASTNMRHLTHLVLHRNPIDADGAHALQNSPHLAQLTLLGLDGQGVSKS